MIYSNYKANLKNSFWIFMQEAVAHPVFPVSGVEIEAGL
jgi:hypothetical protein